MNYSNSINQIFFERGELENTKAEIAVREALDGMDDGELFLEYCQ